MQSSSSEQPKHYNLADLRWPGGQQINHQTYLELLKMICLAINMINYNYQVKKNSISFNFKIWFVS